MKAFLYQLRILLNDIHMKTGKKGQKVVIFTTRNSQQQQKQIPEKRHLIEQHPL